ncbi:MAG: hypothetical protein JNL98_30795 [Bryobacterales bacterium]|nr:hypothetical protein [Bryobacterales bacterium]
MAAMMSRVGASHSELGRIGSLRYIVRGVSLPGGAKQMLEAGFRLFGSADPLTSRIRTTNGDHIALNRFAALLIAREPERHLPGAFVAITRFRGVKPGRADLLLKRVFGPLPKLLDRAMGMLEAETGVITDKTLDPFNGGTNNTATRAKRSSRSL